MAAGLRVVTPCSSAPVHHNSCRRVSEAAITMVLVWPMLESEFPIRYRVPKFCEMGSKEAVVRASFTNIVVEGGCTSAELSLQMD